MKKLLLILAVCVCFYGLAQDKNRPEEYVEMYYEIAVRKMHEYKIPASITLAQGILESGSGNSALARNANNHFGIKCHSDWTGEGYYMDDDAEDECFRVYATAEESFADHSKFLTTRVRYKFLFDDYKTTDFKGWAKGLKKAGYATNPNYPNLLIHLIEKYGLDKYDKMNYSPIVKEPEIVIEKPIEEPVIELPKGAYFTDKAKGIFIFNKIKTVKSNGRQALAIAMEYDVPYERILKYNDIIEGDKFGNQQFVYLQPKRKKGAAKAHIVQPGQTVWEISQLYGIKVAKLRNKNLLEPKAEVKSGETIYLKSKREKAPKTVSYKELIEQKESGKKTIDKEKLKEKVIEPKETIQEKPKEIINESKINGETKIADTVKDNTKTEPAEKAKTHTVAVGQTLYFISNKYYITVEELMELNNLKDYNLKVGQVLLVSPNEPDN